MCTLCLLKSKIHPSIKWLDTGVLSLSGLKMLIVNCVEKIKFQNDHLQAGVPSKFSPPNQKNVDSDVSFWFWHLVKEEDSSEKKIKSRRKLLSRIFSSLPRIALENCPFSHRPGSVTFYFRYKHCSVSNSQQWPYFITL